MSDYAELLTTHDEATRRLREALSKGRWAEAKEMAILAEQQLRAIATECYRLEKARIEDEANWQLPDRPRYFEDFT